MTKPPTPTALADDTPSCGSDDPELAKLQAGRGGPVDHPRIERAAWRAAADLFHDAAKGNGAARLHRFTRLTLLLAPTRAERIWASGSHHDPHRHIRQSVRTGHGCAWHHYDGSDRKKDQQRR
jgi:hypothetical protein